MAKKYKQPGYQDRSERTEQRRNAPAQFGREGPRSPRMTAFRQTMRCAICGAVLPPGFGDIQSSSRCPNCEADLHTCKNCVFFDPASRFECAQPIPERVAKKGEANRCTVFEARTTVEKETTEKATTSRATPSLDPREAFERLFKK